MQVAAFLVRLDLAMELLSWNSEFIKTIPGMAMAIQAVTMNVFAVEAFEGFLKGLFCRSVLPSGDC